MKLSLLAILISVFTLSFYVTGVINEEQEPNGYHLTLIAVSDNTTFTAYNTLSSQTDDSPCIGARNNNLCELRPILREKGQMICASRDLPLDTIIYIEGFGECVILDRMNIRYKGTGRVDILMDTREEAINFGIRKLNYVIVE